MHTIDLNCDLGEGFGHDAELIALVSSVNVACGAHAGDDETMRTAIRLAAAAGVGIGAHPGYEDPANFGRVATLLPPGAVRDLVLRQVERLLSITHAEHATVRHVKPHGALYHAAASDAAIADAVLDGIIDPSLAVVGPPAGRLLDAALQRGRLYVREGFIDRRYKPDGTLVPRGRPDAVVGDPDDAARQAVSLAVDGRVIVGGDSWIDLDAQTLCVHGDGPSALPVLRAARHALESNGITIRPWPHPPGRTPPGGTAASAG